MAYNKTKHVEAAQKFLHQGKIAQAIGEYQHILKNEPKDQVTLMTVGDLFVRQGETFQALEYFERLAQIFLAEGFVSKAIAIYKKIAKLAPEETRPVERLAELYVQQGVLSEARPIYLQLAELHQRAGRQQQSAGLLRKLLEAEPDNLRVLEKLADLSLAMGEPAEAVAAFRSAAELLHRRGEHAEAIKFADRALKADPDDLPTLALKARVLAAGSHSSDAIALLQSLPGLDEGTETSDLLIDLYLEAGDADRASELATKIFARNSKHFAPAHHVAATLLESSTPDQALVLLDLIRGPITDAGHHDQLSQSLNRAAELLPGRLEPREWLVELYGTISDSFRLPDALANLAAALEAAGQHERAQQVYAQLVDRAPDSESARSNYERLRRHSGQTDAAPLEVSAPAGHEAKAASATEAPVDEETQRFVSQALTDVDLFSSYGLTQKAIDLLETVLQRAPRHTPSLERLLDLHLGAGDEQRTAALAAQLQRIHAERGDSAAADRFGELQRRFESAAEAVTQAPATTPDPIPDQAPSTQPESLAAAEALPADESSEAVSVIESNDALPVAEPDEALQVAELGEALPAAALDQALPVIDLEDGVLEELDAGDAAVHEVDLSDEWAALAAQLAQMPSPSADQEFELKPEPPPLPEPEPLPQAKSEPEPFVEPLPEPLSEPLPAPIEVPEIAMASPEPEPEPEPLPAPAPEEVSIEPEPEPAPEFELELEPLPEPAASSTETLSADEFLDALSTEFANALPELTRGFPSPSSGEPDLAEYAAYAGEAAPEPPAPQDEPVPAETAGLLGEMFEEFRAELGDLIPNGEDLETHYNLGIAYREMGLVDEAISEFQKVAKANKKGEAFRYAMQCCTLLGLAFMEKGQPFIAAMWYERALEIPGLDQESVLALRYDLGVAQELSGDTPAALRSFSQVYGMNIDYRDVAERLASLGKES
jgi:pilus assembly protein FimV